MQRETIKKWLDELAMIGQVTIQYDGGNDNGCIDLLVGGESNYEDPDKIESKVTDLALDELNYGSFAGDFNCSGTLYYNPDNGEFAGTDLYSENDTYSLDLREDEYYSYKPIAIRIPKHIWFDSISIGTDSHIEDFDVVVEMLISNGPVTEEHAEVERTTEKYVKDCMDNLISAFEGDYDITYVYNDNVINYNDFKEEGEFLVAYIDEFNFNYDNTNEKDVSFFITENQDQDETV